LSPVQNLGSSRNSFYPVLLTFIAASSRKHISILANNFYAGFGTVALKTAHKSAIKNMIELSIASTLKTVQK
jgi:hypothetical protein